MAVKLDRSERTVVVYCTDCRGFAEVVTRDERAHDVAVEHEQRAHPGADQAWRAPDIWRARHAAG